MSVTISAVYRDGVFLPDTPPDLQEGTAVSIVVQSQPLVLPLTPGRAAYEMLRAIAEMPEEPGGDPTIGGSNHDAILYGDPNGAR